MIEKQTVRIDILDPITAEEAQKKSMKGRRALKITINAIEREVKLVAIALSKANPNLGLATIWDLLPWKRKLKIMLIVLKTLRTLKNYLRK